MAKRKALSKKIRFEVFKEILLLANTAAARRLMRCFMLTILSQYRKAELTTF